MPDLPASLALTTIADGSLRVAAPVRNNFTSTQTAVNALIAALASGTVGQFLRATDSDTVAWAGAYTSYTPTWTDTGAAPAIGNAVVVAQYLQIGKLVHAYGRITFGTTSTYGAGSWSFALPVTASANGLAASAVGVAQMYDSSANAFGLALAQLGTTTTLRAEFGATYLGADTLASASAPWTWATGDILSWNITYEAA